MFDVDVEDDFDPDPDGILPAGATVIDYGFTPAAGWGAVQFPDGSEYWGATDLRELFILGYRENLAVYYAYSAPFHGRLSHLWRFDTVGQRPPAVRLVELADLATSERCDLPAELPEPLAVLFDVFELEIV